MKTMHRLLTIILLIAAVSGCGVKRDDTTGATRQLTAELLGVNYSDVKPTTTLGDLGCDDLDVVELIMEMEESFDISITDDEFEALGISKGWSSVTILQLADLARSKREL
jgi:acyl carrier protein